MNITLTRPQFAFLQMPQKFRAYVGGYGSGKTFVGCCSLLSHHNEFPGVNSAYYAPTYRTIKDVFYPTIEEVAFLHDWRIKVRISDNEVEVYRHGSFLGIIRCRSMDKPNSIVGYKSGRALVDELDTLPTDKARDAWSKIIARMRYKVAGLQNGIDVTTTPEGFKFTYQRFVKERTASYGLIQASTKENAINLNDDYIAGLLETYPEQLVEAYVNGEFVNLVSGSVYGSFDRFLNNAPGVYPKTGEPLLIGMDFNVGQMSAVIHVVRPYFSRIEGRQLVKMPFAVGELTRIFDTPAMIEAIQEVYPKHHITIYPDASGKSRKTVQASTSDIKLLKDAGFKVKAKKKNPFVKDRINSMNSRFKNASGEHCYLVNVAACPDYTACLEQQAYDKNGLPDKDQGLDHLPDAGGYFIEHDFGLTKPRAQTLDF